MDKQHTLALIIIIGIITLVFGHYWVQTDKMMNTYQVVNK